MARVTEAEVRKTLDTDSTVSMIPFITAATSLTDAVSSNDSDSLLSDALLKSIELYLAAFFYAPKDPQYASKSTGKSSGVFQGQYGFGLNGNDWGQRAKLLDITGYLNRLDQPQRPKTSVAWLGLPPTDQTDYVDRD